MTKKKSHKWKKTIGTMQMMKRKRKHVYASLDRQFGLEVRPKYNPRG